MPIQIIQKKGLLKYNVLFKSLFSTTQTFNIYLKDSSGLSAIDMAKRAGHESLGQKPTKHH
jgi:hypothetical protein